MKTPRQHRNYERGRSDATAGLPCNPQENAELDCHRHYIDGYASCEKWLVLSASNGGFTAEPQFPGWVVCKAWKCDEQRGDCRVFIINRAEYRARGESTFVIDEAKHIEVTYTTPKI